MSEIDLRLNVFLSRIKIQDVLGLVFVGALIYMYAVSSSNECSEQTKKKSKQINR